MMKDLSEYIGLLDSSSNYDALSLIKQVISYCQDRDDRIRNLPNTYNEAYLSSRVYQILDGEYDDLTTDELAQAATAVLENFSSYLTNSKNYLNGLKSGITIPAVLSPGSFGDPDNTNALIYKNDQGWHLNLGKYNSHEQDITPAGITTAKMPCIVYGDTVIILGCVPNWGTYAPGVWSVYVLVWYNFKSNTQGNPNSWTNPPDVAVIGATTIDASSNFTPAAAMAEGIIDLSTDIAQTDLATIFNGLRQASPRGWIMSPQGTPADYIDGSRFSFDLTSDGSWPLYNPDKYNQTAESDDLIVGIKNLFLDPDAFNEALPI